MLKNYGLLFLICLPTFVHASARKTARKPTAPEREVALVSQAQAAPRPSPEESATHLKLFGALGGGMVSDDTRKSSLAGFTLGADFRHLLLGNAESESLYLHASGRLILETGSSQATYINEYEPRQGVRLTEALIGGKPFSALRLEAGAINQGRWDHPALLDANAFPGLTETLELGSLVSVSAEQAIPMNSQLKNRPGDALSTPAFFFETIKVGKTLGVSGSYFFFSDLPRSVAHESRFLGNTVRGVGPAGAEFVNTFQGYDLGAFVDMPISASFKLKADGHILANRDAPSGRNSALYGRLRPELRSSPSLIWVPMLEAFRVQSDAVPAYYNSSRIGHTNRTGVGMGLGVVLPKQSLSLDTSYTAASVIEPTAYQADSHQFFLELRKSYDLF